MNNPLGVHWSPPLPPAPRGYRWIDATIHTGPGQVVDVRLVPRWWFRALGNGIDVRAHITPETELTPQGVDSVRKYAATLALRSLRATLRGGGSS